MQLTPAALLFADVEQPIQLQCANRALFLCSPPPVNHPASTAARPIPARGRDGWVTSKTGSWGTWLPEVRTPGQLRSPGRGKLGREGCRRGLLIPWLKQDVDPIQEEMDIEEEMDIKPKDVNIQVIKKGSTYTQIGTRRFKFLDISNYLAGGVSYAQFLKAYKNSRK